jgi:hypothetical protein
MMSFSKWTGTAAASLAMQTGTPGRLKLHIAAVMRISVVLVARRCINGPAPKSFRGGREIASTRVDIIGYVRRK